MLGSLGAVLGAGLEQRCWFEAGSSTLALFRECFWVSGSGGFRVLVLSWSKARHGSGFVAVGVFWVCSDRSLAFALVPVLRWSALGVVVTVEITSSLAGIDRFRPRGRARPVGR